MKNWSQETAATFFANCSIWLKLLINRVDWIALMQMAHFWANLKVDMELLESFYDGKVSFEEQNWLENALILSVKSLRKSDKLSLLGFYSLWDPILLFHFVFVTIGWGHLLQDKSFTWLFLFSSWLQDCLNLSLQITIFWPCILIADTRIWSCCSIYWPKRVDCRNRSGF